MLGLVRGVWVSLASVTLFSQPHFGGCESGGETPEDPVALPVGAAVECTGDDDCRTDACVDARCLGGLCFVIAPTIDRDRDNEQAIPCGMDCDDADPNVNSRRTELCNGRDDNCNATIDEDAEPLSVTFNVLQGDETSVAAPWGDDELLITVTSTGLLAGLIVTPDMRVRGPIELARLLGAGDFAAVQIIAGTDARYLITYTTTAGDVVASVIERTGSTTTSVVEPVETFLDFDDAPVGPSAIAFGDRFVLRYQTTRMGVPEQHVHFWGDADPVYTAPAATPVSQDLATDGTNLVVREGPEIVFLSPAGTEVGRWMVVAPTPRQSIASGDGFVYALSGTGTEIIRVSAAGGPSAPSPSMLNTLTDVRIFRTGPFVLAVNVLSDTEIVVLDALTGAAVDRLLFTSFTGAPPVSLSAVPAFGGGAIVGGSDPMIGGSGASVGLARACGS